jgi:hypothetical protein
MSHTDIVKDNLYYNETMLPASPKGTFRIPSDFALAEDDRVSDVWAQYSRDNITWGEVR